MTALVFKLLGGLGLFLLGMVLLTDGLKAYAGEALRQALVRFTGTPLKAFASGALVTALVQSSSATTVTVIGFVSAGLLTLPQALGVIMGASLGTTGTGWIVAVLGLKVSVGFYALPLVGVGAFLRLLASGRAKSLGLALAGFGLIFIGIETLQAGMAGLAGAINLARVPAGGWEGRLVAVTLGIVLTVLMQSSSAAVATTLTALHTQAVNFEQAASLVIGAAIGTTVTGALAAIGGSVAARRTALAHVLFNLATGIIALASLPGFLRAIAWMQSHLGLEADAISLAAFHTAFIAVGVVLFLPFVHPCAHLLERWLPETGPALTRHLDTTLLHVPAVALEATDRALRQTASELFRAVTAHLPGAATDTTRPNLAEVSAALGRIEEFFGQIPPVFEDEPLSRQREAQLHALDHTWRLLEGAPPPPSEHRALADETLAPAMHRTREILELARAGLAGDAPAGWQEKLARLAQELADLRREERPRLLRETAVGRQHPARTLELLDALRWLDRVGYHTWRLGHHLGGNARLGDHAGDPSRTGS
jgi:phosphate:Na+ symporter